MIASLAINYCFKYFLLYTTERDCKYTSQFSLIITLILFRRTKHRKNLNLEIFSSTFPWSWSDVRWLCRNILCKFKHFSGHKSGNFYRIIVRERLPRSVKKEKIFFCPGIFSYFPPLIGPLSRPERGRNESNIFPFLLFCCWFREQKYRMH